MEIVPFDPYTLCMIALLNPVVIAVAFLDGPARRPVAEAHRRRLRRLDVPVTCSTGWSPPSA